MAEVEMRGLARWCLVLLLGSAAAWAQVNADRIPQVIVSGSRFNESYEAGRAIGATIISAADIRASGVTSVYEALRQLGGVHTRASLSGTSDDTIDLRGFGVTGDQNTLVLIDGLRVSENELQSARLSAIPLNAIERIEILRGGGAVLYGGGATAGVVNVITRGTTAGGQAFNLDALTGSYRTQELRAGASVTGQSVAIDMAVNRASSENYRRNNASQQENAVARVRYLGERGELGLRIVSERQHAQLPGALSTAQFNADPRQAAQPNDTTDTDANHYTLSGNYRFTWGEAAVDVFRRDKVNRFYTDNRPVFGGTMFTRSGSSVDGASPRQRSVAHQRNQSGVELRSCHGQEPVGCGRHDFRHLRYDGLGRRHRLRQRRLSQGGDHRSEGGWERHGTLAQQSEVLRAVAAGSRRLRLWPD